MRHESDIKSMLDRVDGQLVKFEDDGDNEALEVLRDAFSWILFDYIDDGRIVQYFDE